MCKLESLSVILVLISLQCEVEFSTCKTEFARATAEITKLQSAMEKMEVETIETREKDLTQVQEEFNTCKEEFARAKGDISELTALLEGETKGRAADQEQHKNKVNLAFFRDAISCFCQFLKYQLPRN